jgi:hypothetical protein
VPTACKLHGVIGGKREIDFVLVQDLGDEQPRSVFGVDAQNVARAGKSCFFVSRIDVAREAAPRCPPATARPL